jgi:hypothetical protein
MAVARYAIAHPFDRRAITSRGGVTCGKRLVTALRMVTTIGDSHP